MFPFKEIVNRDTPRHLLSKEHDVSSSLFGLLLSVWSQRTLQRTAPKHRKPFFRLLAKDACSGNAMGLVIPLKRFKKPNLSTLLAKIAVKPPKVSPEIDELEPWICHSKERSKHLFVSTF